MNYRPVYFVVAGLLAGLMVCFQAKGDSGATLAAYLEQSHKLREDDIEGRIALAEWCKYNHLPEQQIELLRGVVKRRPDYPSAYEELLAADGKHHRAVDKDWAQRLEKLLGEGFRLHHSRHFTLVSDMDDASSSAQLEALESTYATFYADLSSIGLRPMPPGSRLVCLLFGKHEDYQSYLRRFEGVHTAWTAGHYSWRTNRAAFYHDRDSPFLKETREQLSAAESRIVELRAELEKAETTAKKLVIQEQLKKLNAAVGPANQRFGDVSQLATLAKTRHEAAHQLFFNSGLQKRNRDYPFWLAEGLACAFELCDGQGNASPRFVNRPRLESYLRAARKNELIPLSKLIDQRPGDEDAAQEVAVRYAQAWALAHYLWHKRPGELKSFLGSLEKEAPRDWNAHFQKHFRDDLSVIERELRAHIETISAAP